MTTDEGILLVTGGSRGIGRAVVLAATSSGQRVAFTYRSAEEEAQEVALASDGLATAWPFDLADRERPKALVSEIEETLGPIDGLVNNAGVAHSKLLGMTSNDEWDRVLDTNLGGAFRMCRAVVPLMLRRRRGAIVNLGSLGAERGVAGQGAYAASKAGLLALTRTLAREIGKRRIRVNAVVPGFVATDMTAGLPEAAKDGLRAAEVLPDGATVESVAATVLFLLSPGALGITGQSFFVDAGASS